MTGLYDWNPMPHLVSVRCPQCNSEAKFEFAELVEIKLKQDIPFFQKSDVFEYCFFESTGSGRWHAAFYFHGLKSSSTNEIKDLPDGYHPEDWHHSPYLYRSHGYDVGTIICTTCFLRKKHDLIWPKEAFFQIEHKQRVLWAFDRETVVALIEFIKSRDRKKNKHKWSSFLRHIPTHFLQSGARKPILKKLGNLLTVG